MLEPISDLTCDIAIIGGGTGGCAAALAALRQGMKVVLTEETDWIGGQMTSQAVPPDEHPWIEEFGATRSYRAWRDGVRAYYRDHYPLSAKARMCSHLNPGNSWVSALAHEPRVSLVVLESMLNPYLANGQLQILLRRVPVEAMVVRDRVKCVVLRHLDGGLRTALQARYFLDATELGELLPLTGTEYRTGFESRTETGELHAPAQEQPANFQAFTWCFAVDHVAGEEHTIERPSEYDAWRSYVPNLTPSWPGRLLDWSYPHPIDLDPRALPFDPESGLDGFDGGLWTYRRIADHRNFSDAEKRDICLVNWPQNDYWLGNICDVDQDQTLLHLQRAKQLSFSLLYWLQTEAPRPDGGQGWPGLRLRPDITGTLDGLAKYPYIRESRRIRAEFTILEHHVGVEARQKLTGRPEGELRAESFHDSVGIGSYRIDLHPSSGGDNYIDIPSLPFQIPLGSLIPVRMENLLPAAKNIGVTHITNGCYRLHPVEWNVGEVAGTLAAHAIRIGEPPRRIRNDRKLLEDFQRILQQQGIELAWPSSA